MSPKEPESVIMDMWEVPPGRQRELVDALRELLEQTRLIDGFVDGRIHTSLDGTKVISYSTMRFAADHQRVQERDEIRERLQALESIAVPHRSAYQLECVYTAPTETVPADVSKGAWPDPVCRSTTSERVVDMTAGKVALESDGHA